MIGKIIGAYAGDRLAKQTRGLGGASGAALGVVAAAALRRVSLPAMLAMGVGGYIAKRLYEKNVTTSAANSSRANSEISKKTSAAA